MQSPQFTDLAERRGDKALPFVALAMPRRGPWGTHGALEAFFLWAQDASFDLARLWTANSILDHSFNRCWATALNARRQGVTHFAMLHDDISPGRGWLKVLLDELLRRDADIVSAVVPIKSQEGLSSTAVETDDPWCPRRLTMKEAHRLPLTFGDDQAGGELLLNTGCWVADITRAWVDRPAPLVFQTLNRIIEVVNDEGEPELVAQVRSEDWEFSRAARARGARLLATRRVALTHLGEQEYPSDQPWGAWDTDEVHRARLALEGKNGRREEVPA